MQNYLKFNTEKHTLSVIYIDNTMGVRDLEDVTTIREGQGFYEVLQRQENGKNAPIYRFPIHNTVIRYFH
jgi:hypothetical protein